uniref:Uncharacterized protein n=1 Tax=Homalodisca liturata TaxID=320908 RepID=A0A1B6HPQ6_9HEMI
MACPNAPRVTRQTIACTIIGVPKELSGLSLPTYEDILLCCLDEKYKRSLLFSPNNKKELGFLAIADCVATQVVGIYNKATIPTVTHTRVVQLIQSYSNGLYVCYILMSCHIGIYLNTWMELQQGQLHSVVQSENNSLAVRNFLL